MTTSGLAALLLLAGITIVLQTASAVDVTLTNTQNNIQTSDTVTITMTVALDTDEIIPISMMRLIIEGPSPPAPVKKDYKWAVNGDLFTLDTACALTVTLANTGLGAVSGYGYRTSGNFLGRHTGYGYDSNAGHGAPGYASGENFNSGASSTDVPEGGDVFFGYTEPSEIMAYGYDTHGTFTYTVTFLASCLGAGDFRFTGIVKTDYFDFESLALDLTVGGAGGSGGGGGGGGNTGSGQTQTLTANSITPPTGATAAWNVNIGTASAGNIIVINTGDANFPTIEFTAAIALSNVVVTIVKWPDTAQATQLGVDSLQPSGIDVSSFLSITIGTSGATSSVKITVKLNATDVTADADQAVLLRFVNAKWNPESRITLTLSGGVYTATVTSPCCSVFAVGFDTESPKIDWTAPGGAQTGTIQLQPTATDNLQVNKVEMYVDGTLKDTKTTSPYQFSLDTSKLTNGAHPVRFVAYDFVENTAEKSGDITVQGGQEPTTSPPPSEEEEGKKATNTLMIVIIVLIVVALIVAAFVLAGRKPPGKGPAKPPAKK